MSIAKPVMAGGAAAAIVAGAAALLFPKFSGVQETAQADEAEFRQAREAFADYIGGDAAAAEDLAALGLKQSELPEVEQITLFSEKTRCAGKGIYWLKDDGGQPLAITAPHRGSDRHTGELAAMLFLETGAKAAAWNSAPRNPTMDCPNALDLAREEIHPFTAFSLAFAETYPNGRLVQLHGFEGAKRDSDIARDAAMIVSNGTENPGDAVLALADCLSIAFAPRKTLVYPIATNELGALTNAQGQALRENGFDGFIHLEIAADLRAGMTQDDALRSRLAECLLESAG